MIIVKVLNTYEATSEGIASLYRKDVRYEARSVYQEEINRHVLYHYVVWVDVREERRQLFLYLQIWHNMCHWTQYNMKKNSYFVVCAE